MVDGGIRFDFSVKVKCASYVSHSHVFILGLLLAYDTMFPHVQTSPVNCSPMNISAKYEHCGIRSDGVRDLDCFRKYKSPTNTCVWKPGNHASEKTSYTLIIRQQMRNYCRAHINITGFSEEIRLYEKYDMTAEVFENGASTNCSKAVFSASPKNILRCGPPYKVSFSRHSGRLVVNVIWQQADKKLIKYYSVRYKVLGSLLWSEAPVQSQNGEKCTVENLNSSLVYAVQIQCVRDEKCSQCLWSEAHTVPPELKTQPVIVNLEDTDIADRKGSRLLTLTWKFSDKELHDGYNVTVGKASGEAPLEQMIPTQPEIKLILSYSAYYLQISAFNNASTSPTVSQMIPPRGSRSGMADGQLNVTVHSNTSFTIYWEDNLIINYVCYSVEWTNEGHKAAYMSFYQNENNYRNLSPLPEPLEPYKRYSITLHKRPNKETCNMKHINNSESTYGGTQFYFMEGSPISAPADIDSYNVTLNSAALKWSSIPEEDIRGFLLGYLIHYTEYHHTGTSTERNVTVGPVLNSYELAELESGTMYEVRVSGVTRAGEGVRSKASVFTTKQHPGSSNFRGVIAVLAVAASVLIFGFPLLKRAKVILWPSIPNPGNSNAMQKIERPCELELLESINTLRVEEWDTNSLQIIEKEDAIPASTLASERLLLHASEDEGDSADMTCDWMQGDAEDADEDILADTTSETFSGIQQTDLQTSSFAFPSGYTTMEMFQQVMPANTPVTPESKPEEPNSTVGKSGLDYIRQFSNSPVLDNEDTFRNTGS
uniref:interleukin-31 receptor subunit alpha isoform X2 n=1 Tax=Scatophagus argus TaxID=75038 RepID=UPI001ED86064|nr:interleukin-31 receptor subunit alpha isoform X2 [Scatophagus argus]